MRNVVIGWLLGGVMVVVGAVAGSNWYEYRMLPPADCALFEIGQHQPSGWHIAPSQPHRCYLRRARLRIP